ncbi:hypothetical protein C8255_12480 [filamentous cyanobacterium CCP3]|nr:hypothetical protein C8255_12480 [filamentous cyanobacterium CCP3]
MNNIDYDHFKNVHVLDGPSIIFPLIKEKYLVESILDVGCGLGIWLKVASDCGVKDSMGIDGIEIENSQFLAPKSNFKKQDLTNSWEIGRKYDVVICLEVAEHLPSEAEHNLISSLVKHSDLVIFSAACPHQGGQGHINCQWPEHWQNLFNEYGYSCLDELRPLLWNKKFPEYWYKQNIFVAKKDPFGAGLEPKIMPIIHPDFYFSLQNNRKSYAVLLSGNAGLGTYFSLFVKAFKVFIKSKLRETKKLL